MARSFQRYLADTDGNFRLKDHAAADNSCFDGEKEQGQERLQTLRDKLANLQERIFAENEQKVLVVLQAMDAAGKDSTVRDVLRSTNPMGVHAYGFGRPSDEEIAHDYLWRIHAHTPATGEIAIFNRSHYEDVLVVRVNDLVEKDRWKKRYRHIREFESMLVDEGVTIVKFFLNISPDAQAEQLQQRIDEPAKRWKFDPRDLEVRARWDEYMEAYEDAIKQTSTQDAPWYVIPADRRWYRKLAVAEILVDLLEGLDPQYPPPAEGVEGMVIS
ncbi:MAG: PPK2 family polyphosphate:nucleotide phosphotransferase [Candidatus Poriferisodalaceae bacterium]|jgi:PPK2 family polyphosphate:nucleotide phosphotransferase